MPKWSARPLRNEIAEPLRSRILGGEYQPGTPIREEEIAMAFNVSRVPVREALHLLAQQQFGVDGDHMDRLHRAIDRVGMIGEVGGAAGAATAPPRTTTVDASPSSMSGLPTPSLHGWPPSGHAGT